jgi:hypothetical protein
MTEEGRAATEEIMQSEQTFRALRSLCATLPGAPPTLFRVARVLCRYDGMRPVWSSLRRSPMAPAVRNHAPTPR